jgi:cyanophycinase
MLYLPSPITSAIYCFLPLLISLTPAVSLCQYDPYAIEPVGKLNGSLLLHGGGKMDERTRKVFVELAGGKEAHIVVVPSASAEIEPEEELLKKWREYEHASLAVLHATSRADAESETTLNMLRQATGVWFNGGDQERLETLYVDSNFEVELLNVVKRGGVVGGSSAGAAIASKVMISRGNEHRGFDLLPAAIVDQHFIQRNRQGRLSEMVARHPQRFGIGIDEDTALIVKGRRLSVLGSSQVVIHLAHSSHQPEMTKSLREGDTADLIALHRTVLARQAERFPPDPAPVPQVPQGTLFIVGGGGIPDGLLENFIDKAGGASAPLVYVPCLEEEDASSDRFANVLRRSGAQNVTTLHTKDRTKANSDEAFLEPLKNAKGIWYGGGRQWNFVDSYQNTQAHRLMLAVLERGGAIGGSSAGASIQGDYMPRGDPLGNLNIIAPGYERGLGFLRGVAIDQHFAQRGRFKDMTLLVKTYPQLLGIGIDESTAIIVTGNSAEVVGQGKVAFYDAKAVSEAEPSGDPKLDPEINTESSDAKDYVSLAAGARYDLKERRVITKEINTNQP